MMWPIGPVVPSQARGGACVAKTVLVIEDDPSILKLVGECLDLAGYRAELAADGVEGLARFRASAPDLVLLDLMLPAQQGLDVARAIRADPIHAAIPILLVSARQPNAEESSLADGYLPKPFRLVALLHALQHALYATSQRGP